VKYSNASSVRFFFGNSLTRFGVKCNTRLLIAEPRFGVPILRGSQKHLLNLYRRRKSFLYGDYQTLIRELLAEEFLEQRDMQSGVPADHQTFIPPSTTISTPVTYELSSEARNKATFATSSGRPRRPSSVLPSIALAHSGSFSCSRV
jgi:hypothetical protein